MMYVPMKFWKLGRQDAASASLCVVRGHLSIFIFVDLIVLPTFSTTNVY